MHIPTLEDIVRPYISYPATIRQALILVETHPSFKVLTRSYLKVLKALVSRISKRNGFEPVKARVDHLAEEANVSEKTVQRALAFLAKIEWVHSATDGRSEYGLFCSREYQFSAELCALLEVPVPATKARRKDKNEAAPTESQHEEMLPLGDTNASESYCKLPTNLVEPPISAAEPLEIYDQETQMSDGVYIDLSFKRHQREIREKIPSENRITIPDSLQPLRGFGIKDTGICKLMRLATAAGHRLDNVFQVARDRLTAIGAVGNRAYRYLLAMIDRRADYAARAEQLARISADTEAAELNHERSTKYRWKHYRGPAGMTVRVFDGTAEVCKLDGTYMTIVGREMEQIYDAIEIGKLIEAGQ